MKEVYLRKATLLMHSPEHPASGHPSVMLKLDATLLLTLPKSAILLEALLKSTLLLVALLKSAILCEALLKSAILLEAPLMEGVPASGTGTLSAMLLDKLKLDATLHLSSNVSTSVRIFGSAEVEH